LIFIWIPFSSPLLTLPSNFPSKFCTKLWCRTTLALKARQNTSYMC
jgi:hypothetical protein